MNVRLAFGAVLVCCWALLAASGAMAQAPDWAWAKKAGGAEQDYGESIATDAQGNTYVTGYFYSPTITFGTTTLNNAGGDNLDIFIAKYDPAGQVLWAKQVGGTSVAGVRSIAADAQGNAYITGYFSSPTITFGGTTLTQAGGGDIFITKYDPSGQVLWAKQAGGIGWEIGQSIAIDAQGNAYFTGAFASPTITFGSTTLTNAGTTDILIAKYDPSGQVLWAKSAGGTSIDYGYGIATDAQGNAYITGQFDSHIITLGSTTLTNAGTTDILIAKYDPSGQVLWAKQAGGASDDRVFGIATDAQGYAYVVGLFWSPTISFISTSLINAGYSDVLIAKYAPSGQLLWAKQAGGTSSDEGSGIATDAQGNAYVTGFFSSPTITFGITTLNNAGSADIFITKYDPSGQVLWVKQAGGTGDDRGNAIAIDAQGNAYVTGRFWSFTAFFGNSLLTSAGNYDMFIAKLDNTTAIEPLAEGMAGKFMVAPNPTSDLFTVSGLQGSEILTLRNALGQVVSTTTAREAQTTLDLSAQPAGIYLLQVANGSSVQTVRVVKQ